ncbi:DUF4440 domain-containing protein [Pseudomonas sp. YJ42]|uniref:DUF4440 domain-containing protein n=1 Tax=Pseudomonas sp. YJ42 TaxID=3392115 RepID=UPI0039A3F7E2
MKNARLTIAGLLFTAAAMPTLAADADTLKQALRERLDVVEARWEQNDAKGIVAEAYVPETEITGEQTEPLFTGTEALTSLVESLVADSTTATIRLDRVTPLGADSAYTWVTWDVQPNAGEPFQMKSLFVWKRMPQGWRIVADMYASGSVLK